MCLADMEVVKVALVIIIFICKVANGEPLCEGFLVTPDSIVTAAYCFDSGLSTEHRHITSWQPFWCSKIVRRRPCWCTKPIWEFNFFLMETLSFVPISLHGCLTRGCIRCVWTTPILKHRSLSL